MKKTIATIFTISLAFTCGAQSKNFKQGQWMEIYNAVVQEVNRYYVDSLPIDRMYKASVDAMLECLDPYTIYVPESEQDDFELMVSNSYGGIGAIVQKKTKDGYVVINEPYANSPAARAGLQCGDQIMNIDGESVIGLEVNEATSKMKGKPGTTVVFHVKKVRSGEEVDLKITREKIHMPNVEYSGILPNEGTKTGYIYLSGFTNEASSEVRDALVNLKKQGAERIILDIRGNGGGLLDEAVKIVSLFVPKGTTVVTSKGTDGEYIYNTRTEPVDTKIPLMVLVDSGSASASEIVSGAIQDLDRGVVAGRRTFGKGLVQKILPVNYNGTVKVTVAKYYTPSGRCVQAKDYSHRAEDGSVGNIPDSLTHEFKTSKGRTVRDGGGITPDIELAVSNYNRITYAVVYSGLTNSYPIEFVQNCDNVPEDFHMSDEQWNAWLDWASNEKFDSRSESQTYYDLLAKQLEKDGEMEMVKEPMEALKKVVQMDKRSALDYARAQIQPLLEEEIVVRYHYQAAGIPIRLRTDTQLEQALKEWK